MTFEKEDSRRKITFRVSESLGQQLDERENKSETIREALRQYLGSTDDYDTPLEPPADETLATAYRKTVDLADGRYIRPNAVLPALAAELGIPADVIRQSVMVSLESRGYIKLVSDGTGQQLRYKING